jgi:RHS repeat-associated protein
VSFGYDDALQLTSQTDPKNGGGTISFHIDERGRRDRITYPSGVTHSQTFDIAGRIKQILLEQTFNGTDLQKFTYSYGLDGSGNQTSAYRHGFVTGVTELSGATVSYSYDDLGRLSGATRTGTGAFTQSYTYDDADNRLTFTSGGTTTTFTYDAANQLISDGTTSYDYDRNGNLVQFGANDLVYDGANKWVSGDVAGVTLAFDYDGLGRQVGRDWSTNHTDFWFDQSGMTLESGSTSGTYLRDPSGLLLSAYIGGSGPVRNYARDRLGSITGLTSTAGALDRSYTYDPWGTVVASSGSASNNFRFTGGRIDPTATGWYVLGQRTYSISLGRFTQVDPRQSGFVTTMMSKSANGAGRGSHARHPASGSDAALDCLADHG